jgi:hypothetical protein
MNTTDRILDTVQRKVELDGRSHADCVYLNDLSFTIERDEYEVPSEADLMGATVDVSWFFMSADAHQVVPHPVPDRSVWLRLFGSDAIPYGHTWNLDQLIDNLNSPEAWRRGVLFNPCVTEAPPCVTCYQFHPDNDWLHSTTTLRSSDVYKVLPQDVTMTNLILGEIALQLGLKPGRMTFNLGNAHAFYEDMEYVEEYTLDWGD